MSTSFNATSLSSTTENVAANFVSQFLSNWTDEPTSSVNTVPKTTTSATYTTIYSSSYSKTDSPCIAWNASSTTSILPSTSKPFYSSISNFTLPSSTLSSFDVSSSDSISSSQSTLSSNTSILSIDLSNNTTPITQQLLNTTTTSPSTEQTSSENWYSTSSSATVTELMWDSDRKCFILVPAATSTPFNMSLTLPITLVTTIAIILCLLLVAIAIILVIRHRRINQRKADFVQEYLNARRPSDNHPSTVVVTSILPLERDGPNTSSMQDDFLSTLENCSISVVSHHSDLPQSPESNSNLINSNNLAQSYERFYEDSGRRNEFGPKLAQSSAPLAQRIRFHHPRFFSGIDEARLDASNRMHNSASALSVTSNNESSSTMGTMGRQSPSVVGSLLYLPRGRAISPNFETSSTPGRHYLSPSDTMSTGFSLSTMSSTVDGSVFSSNDSHRRISLPLQVAPHAALPLPRSTHQERGRRGSSSGVLSPTPSASSLNKEVENNPNHRIVMQLRETDEEYNIV